MEFNIKVREEMQGNVHARMGELYNHILYRRRAKDLNQGIWDAMNMLNTLRDDSDPDVSTSDISAKFPLTYFSPWQTNMSQMEHLLQTAEAIRLDGKPEWMQVVGLVHDLGKLLYFFDSQCVFLLLSLFVSDVDVLGGNGMLLGWATFIHLLLRSTDFF